MPKALCFPLWSVDQLTIRGRWAREPKAERTMADVTIQPSLRSLAALGQLGSDAALLGPLPSTPHPTSNLRWSFIHLSWDDSYHGSWLPLGTLSTGQLLPFGRLLLHRPRPPSQRSSLHPSNQKAWSAYLLYVVCRPIFSSLYLFSPHISAG